MKPLHGTVVAAHGRQYLVELNDATLLLCFPRGKKSEIAVGDRVEVGQTAPGQGVIERIDPRRSLLYRSNEFRQKLIAANVTQVVLVVAVEPSFSDDLVSRCLVAASEQDIAATLVLNKADLTDRLPAARQALAPFVALGLPVVELSAHDPASVREQLLPRLHGHTSVLVGQSGMGKSTLINALIPEAQAATREISAALDSGKHTTTHARLYWLEDNTGAEHRSALIDSPGLQDFGLNHLSRDEITHGFPELHDLLGQCRFRDCRHDREPDCVLRAAAEAGQIDPRRWALFRTLFDGASN